MPVTNIVVSRYNRNVDFVYKMNENTNIMIYDKENEENPLNIPVNKGNEASVYLKYIIDYYDILSEFTFFIQDEEYSWHHYGSIIDRYDEAKKSNKLFYNINSFDFDKNSILNLNGEEVFNNFMKWYEEYIEEDIPLLKLPNKDFCHGYKGCAQFLVHKDVIRKLPKKFYEKLYNWIITTDLLSYYSGRYLEWTWHLMWDIYPYLEKKSN